MRNALNNAGGRCVFRCTLGLTSLSGKLDRRAGANGRMHEGFGVEKAIAMEAQKKVRGPYCVPPTRSSLASSTDQ